MSPSSPAKRRRRFSVPASGQRRRSSRLALLATAHEGIPIDNDHDHDAAAAAKRSRKEKEDDEKGTVSAVPEEGKGKGVLIHEEEGTTSEEEDEISLDGDEENPDGRRVGTDLRMDANEETPVNRRARDRAFALEAAPRFAYFKQEEEEADDDDNDDGEEEEDEEEGNARGGGSRSEDDWPGPFSTAMKLIREREERLRARGERKKAPKVEVEWKPTRKEGFLAEPPSLRELAVKVLAANAEHLESLQGVPGSLLKLIASSVCGLRTIGCGFLSVLATNSPTEIYVPDCSLVAEEKFDEIFRGCNTENLEVLQLDLSGRCLPDDVLSSTLARAPNSLPKLVSVSLVGNYRLSDDGLMLLARSAPMLHSINLSQCSFITSAGVIELLKKLEGVIKELILDDCQNVSGIAILPALKRLQQLQAISVSRLQCVNNKFVSGLVTACFHLEELGLAGCLKVSSRSTKVIGEQCPRLCNLDLRNIVKLNDKAIAYLASGCLSFQKLLLQRNDFSDEAVAAFIEASGASLVELSLNNLAKVSHHTALAISRRCSLTLHKLDLSFCRMMSDEALGLIVDSCTKLRVLKLFGCTQVTGLFLNGHSNPGVKIIGIRGNILNHTVMPGVLTDW